MNGDLISREALKKEVENLVVGGAEGLKKYYENGSKSDENSWIGGVYDAWELIDNAPTVMPEKAKEGELINAYTKGFDNGVEIARTERPQGEWIFGSTLGHGWMKCSNCCVSQSEQTLCWSYCPNCGADMRGRNE